MKVLNERIRELRQQRAEIAEKMQELHQRTVEEKRDFHQDEKEQWDRMKADVDRLDEQIRREEELAKYAADQTPEQRRGVDPDSSQPKNEFRHFGEFLRAVRFNPSDPRLHQIDAHEARDLQMSEDAAGGYLVPPQFANQLLQVDPKEAIFRPRATVIPADATSPDAKFHFPALDQSGTKGYHSGVQVTWIEEGAEKPATEPSFREITWEPYEVAAHTVVTDKLLRNSPYAVGTLVEQILRRAIVADEERQFLQGDGVGKPTGIIGHSATIELNRDTANEIKYKDVVAMYAKMLFGGPLVWIASQTTLPQLMQMTDSAGNLVWQPNAREGAPGTLLGIPVLISNRTPTLGSKGDLILADLTYYVIKDGYGISVSASEHVKFTSNKTVIKAFWNVDGKLWLNSPIEDENGENVSPVVVLDEPAV